MTKLLVVSRNEDNNLKKSAFVKKSVLKFKETNKIVKAVSEHTYVLSNNRSAMDAEGVKNALGWDNEGTMDFISKLNDSKKLSTECGKILVYISVVYGKANHRTEQPFDVKKKEKSKLGRNLMLQTLENKVARSNDKDK
jgi:hypothetical protein